MRTFFLLAFVCLSRFGFSQSQADMNAMENLHFEMAEKELNDAYNKILAEYKSDTVFIVNLKNSQKIWNMFRSAEVKMKFPTRAAGAYGSVEPMCRYQYLTMLTQTRTKTLKVWLDGIKEGDVCSGSVKTSK